MSPITKPSVVVAGGSGFIGQALADVLAPRFDVIGLSRSAPADLGAFTSWRPADLFSLRDAEQALAGADLAVYLVHSMMPSARLAQGNFADFDLICADNFARAAKHQGVKQIVYLGGLLPEGVLSPHLQSRREVELTLGGQGVPLTVLRAGLVIGGGGSSFDIVTKLVHRLPVMILPSWTRTRTQPVSLDDVVALLAFTVGRSECFDQVYDVGAPEVMTYRELMILTASLMNRRRPMLDVPFVTPALSRLWVSVVTGASRELVGPLIESLRHEMIARDLRLAELAELPPETTRVALTRALQGTETPAAPKAVRRPKARVKPEPTVRSVQRMTLPAGRDAEWAAREYVRWLPNALWLFIRVETEEQRNCRFYFHLVPWPLLVLTYAAERSRADRQLFFVTGGLLASNSSSGPQARFELRQALDGETLLTAIHDFRPSLPWWVYRMSQALFHAWVMAAFRRHLGSIRRDEGGL